MDNVHVVPDVPWSKRREEEDHNTDATLVTVEVPIDPASEGNEEVTNDTKKHHNINANSRLSHIFDVGCNNLPRSPVIGGRPSAFHSYAKNPDLSPGLEKVCITFMDT